MVAPAFDGIQQGLDSGIVARDCMVSVCMLTELERYRAIIPFKNPGGMGTNVPMVARELENVGVRVLLNQPKGEYDVLHVHSPLPESFLWALRRRKKGKPLVVHGRHLQNS